MLVATGMKMTYSSATHYCLILCFFSSRLASRGRWSAAHSNAVCTLRLRSLGNYLGGHLIAAIRFQCHCCPSWTPAH